MSIDPRPFSEIEQRILTVVLDEIIPTSADAKLPGAGQAGVIAYVDRVLQRMPDLRAMVIQGLADLDAAVRVRHGRAFAALTAADRAALLVEVARHGAAHPAPLQPHQSHAVGR